MQKVVTTFQHGNTVLCFEPLFEMEKLADWIMKIRIINVWQELLILISQKTFTISAYLSDCLFFVTFLRVLEWAFQMFLKYTITCSFFFVHAEVPTSVHIFFHLPLIIITITIKELFSNDWGLKGWITAWQATNYFQTDSRYKCIHHGFHSEP